MATETPYARTATVYVQTGTSASGTAILAGVSLGSLDKSTWDADKALNIASALEPILAEEIAEVRSSGTVTLSAS